MLDFSNFKCDNCGACCQTLIVEADWVDAMREPKLFQIEPSSKGNLALRDSGCCVVLHDKEKGGRRTHASRGGSSASGASMKGAAFASPALKNPANASVSALSAQKTAPVAALPEKGISRFLLIVGLVLMFILAIFLGGVIFVLTIPGRNISLAASI